MSIATELSNLITDLRTCRNNIIAKGVEISPTAGFEEVAEKILDIQTTASTGTVTDDSMSMLKQVPLNSISHCYVKSIGGMTYKCNQLIPFPYTETTKTVNGITYTVNDGGTIEVSGIATGYSSFQFATIDIITGVDYCYSGVQSATNITLVVNFFDENNQLLGSKTSYSGSIVFNSDTYSGAKKVKLEIKRENNIAVSGVVYPMLNVGTTALPYEPFFKGLRDNKVTAIKSYGANHLDLSSIIGTSVTMNGGTLTCNADRSITGSGTPTGGCSFNLSNKNYLPKRKYTLCAEGDFDGMAFAMYVRTYSGTQIVGAGVTSSKRAITVDLSQYADYSYVTFEIKRDANNMPMSGTAYFYIVEGGYTATTMPSYKPYHSPATYLIPESLQGTGKGVEGASDTMDFEMDEKLTNCTTVTFDGTEPWDYRADYNCVIMTRTLSKVGKGSAYIITSAPMYIEFSNSSNNRFSFGKRTDAIENYGITSAEDWQNYLAERYASGNPVTVTYAIADPTETDIDTFAFDPLIKVEGGGSLEIITDNGGAVPTSIIYQTII